MAKNLNENFEKKDILKKRYYIINQPARNLFELHYKSTFDDLIIERLSDYYGIFFVFF